MLKYKFLYDRKWVCVCNQLESKMVQSLVGELKINFKIPDLFLFRKHHSIKFELFMFFLGKKAKMFQPFSRHNINFLLPDYIYSSLWKYKLFYYYQKK